MISNSGPVHNTINGGIQIGPVLQGRDLSVVIRPTAAAPIALAQLPPRVVGFVGRGDALQEITELLDPAAAAGTVVVSAVGGLAGVGKTALAITAGHVARERGWYRGGVLFIDLHGYDQERVEPEQALDALLRALGVPGEHIPPGTEARSALYRSVLTQIPEPVLVLADNASAEAQVWPLLPGGGPHRVVVTSRHTLAGLEARLLDVPVLDDATAVQLLDLALRTARPEDNRASSDQGAAVRLARVCGGLPLALQIVAALLKMDPVRSVAEVADELQVGQTRLKRLNYEDGSGKPSVAAAFGLSYRQLEQSAARLFRLLPINPGPDVSTHTAGVLAGFPFGQARAVLSTLAKAHLVEVVPGAEQRWRMHDLLRLYAQQLCDEDTHSEEREHALDRLLAYYLDKTAVADEQLRAQPDTKIADASSNLTDTLAWLDAERSNLVAAVGLAANTGRDKIALLLPVNLAEYLNSRRRFDDLIATFAISVNAARHLGDREKEAAALDALGVALYKLRRLAEAISAHQEAAAIFQEVVDRRGEGMALVNLANALWKAKLPRKAYDVSLNAAVILRETSDRRGECAALELLCYALREDTNLEAISTLREKVAISRETGARTSEGVALRNLGVELRRARQFKEAITVCNDAAAIFRATGDRLSEGIAMNELGSALSAAKQYKKSIIAFREAVAVFRETGDRLSEGVALNNLGDALEAAKRYEEASVAFGEAVASSRETGDRFTEAMALYNLSARLSAAKRHEEAITGYREAAAIFRETGDRYAEAVALCSLGDKLHDTGQFDEAIFVYRGAQTIFEEADLIFKAASASGRRTMAEQAKQKGPRRKASSELT